METITLTSPEVVNITTTDYRVGQILLTRFPEWRISVIFIGTNGERKTWMVEGARAQTLITALNKANLTAKSLERRCIEQAAADGVFVGSITGTPD